MAGHTRLATTVFMPLILLMVDWLFEACHSGLPCWRWHWPSVVTSHMQITYYCWWRGSMAVLTIARLNRDNPRGCPRLGPSWPRRRWGRVRPSVAAGARVCPTPSGGRSAPPARVTTPRTGRSTPGDADVLHPRSSASAARPTGAGCRSPTRRSTCMSCRSSACVGVACGGGALHDLPRDPGAVRCSWRSARSSLVYDPLFPVARLQQAPRAEHALVMTRLAVALLAALGWTPCCSPRRAAAPRRTFRMGLAAPALAPCPAGAPGG